ncbi:MAG TPA: response regulator [Chitinophagaceae bacterium]|nr:response regulator [Chitinophagaceae bacterium]
MKKVLIIDDETDFCLLLRAYLSRLKYDVYCSNTLSDGVEEAKKIDPSIIFLDNNLPDGLGWEMAMYFLQQYPSAQLNLISAYHPHLPNVKVTPALKIWEKPISLTELEKYLKEEDGI